MVVFKLGFGGGQPTIVERAYPVLSPQARAGSANFSGFYFSAAIFCR
jgi:hypothetical protein